MAQKTAFFRILLIQALVRIFVVGVAFPRRWVSLLVLQYIPGGAFVIFFFVSVGSRLDAEASAAPGNKHREECGAEEVDRGSKVGVLIYYQLSHACCTYMPNAVLVLLLFLHLVWLFSSCAHLIRSVHHHVGVAVRSVSRSSPKSLKKNKKSNGVRFYSGVECPLALNPPC